MRWNNRHPPCFPVPASNVWSIQLQDPSFGELILQPMHQLIPLVVPYRVAKYSQIRHRQCFQPHEVLRSQRNDSVSRTLQQHLSGFEKFLVISNRQHLVIGLFVFREADQHGAPSRQRICEQGRRSARHRLLFVGTRMMDRQAYFNWDYSQSSTHQGISLAHRWRAGKYTRIVLYRLEIVLQCERQRS